MNSPMNILIAYDGSAGANHALHDLLRAGLPETANVRILNVAESWMPILADSDHTSEPTGNVSVDPVEALAQEVVNDARKVVEIAARRLRTHFPGWNVEATVTCDSPALGILRTADLWKPDLIIVGSQGHSALERLLIGSVSQKVLTESHSSVRIAREHTTVEGSPVRIIIGTDGTPDAEAAVQMVASRAWPSATTVRVIAVHGPVDMAIPPFGSYMNFSIHEAIARQYELLETVVKTGSQRLQDVGLIASGEVIEGKPVPVLLRESKEWGADAIFIGARGHGFFERFLLGSVSASLAARAHCSVEIIRTDQPKEKQ